MEARNIIVLILAFTSCFSFAISSQEYRGRWKLLKKDIGVSAMHIALLPNERVVTFDRTDAGHSNITLPKEKCKGSHTVADCYAHSVEFDVYNMSVRPLTVITDTWCSSGALLPSGTLIQSGGFKGGYKVVRYFRPCEDCDWDEDPDGLVSPRWYASNQILPEGNVIVVGGRDQFSFEFIPRSMSSERTQYRLPFLHETMELQRMENNLYPFLHLSPDGNLFIFANNRSILLDYKENKVVRTYPDMPGGVARNYPSTGSSVLLPLRLSLINSSAPNAEAFICGGTHPYSSKKANAGIFIEATKSCGRMMITSTNPKWEMEEMPLSRVMGDMILLPTGDVLIINGAKKGSAGWNAAMEPVLNPVLYRPNADDSDTRKFGRFEVMKGNVIPRLYHSSAHLLSDGRVLVGGSNPHAVYNFSAMYPTELSVEAFYPPYLDSSKSRPSNVWVSPGTEVGYMQKFKVNFQFENMIYLGENDNEKVKVTMVAPSFTTHSFSMNQRVLVLANDGVRQLSAASYHVECHAPANAALAPPGYYQLFVIYDGVPSIGKWVQHGGPCLPPSENTRVEEKATEVTLSTRMPPAN
ncbi:Galactose oxidase-like, Early set domain [Dillenia turbinata]|uniref:Galactose oxidase-like, Early set domain n=1 Tax=Dillenia turbinata TaxID=194707 RepID=A0AAN8ZS19_9MAGN